MDNTPHKVIKSGQDYNFNRVIDDEMQTVGQLSHTVGLQPSGFCGARHTSSVSGLIYEQTWQEWRSVSLAASENLNHLFFASAKNAAEWFRS